MRIMTKLLALMLALMLTACAALAEDGDQLLDIQSKGEIVVATEGAWAPWTYHDEAGTLVGFDVEVAQAIAAKLGVTATFAETEWDGIFAGLDSGRYDIAANGVEITDERAETYDFSVPYGYIRTALIVRGDNEDITSFEDLNGKHTANSIASTYMTLAESYGVLLYCNTFSAQEIRIITASPEFAARLPRLFKRAFGLGFDVLPKEGTAGKSSFKITDRDKLKKIFDAFGAEIDGTVSHHINFGVIEDDCCRASFIRGAFLAGGSVTDPEKRYHLELATPHHSVSREAYSVLLELGFTPKETQRGGNWLLYFKQADFIADFFTAIGAPGTAMNIMTAKVEKEMRNTITRRVNCDSANADKVVAAAQEQIDAIRRIVREYGIDALPEPLKDAALLRIANPEASLADLATLSYPPVTKSCLSHRLKKIMSFKPEE